MSGIIREKLICKSLAFDGVNDRLTGPNFTNINFNTFRMWDTQLDLSRVTKEYNNGFGRLQPVLPNSCKLDLNMSKSIWDGSKFLVKNNTNITSDFESLGMSELNLINNCYQI